MTFEQARCKFHGAEFVGSFEVTGSGPELAVHVRYKDQDIEARTGGLPVEAVVETLLKNLVEWERDRIDRKPPVAKITFGGTIAPTRP